MYISLSRPLNRDTTSHPTGYTGVGAIPPSPPVDPTHTTFTAKQTSTIAPVADLRRSSRRHEYNRNWSIPPTGSPSCPEQSDTRTAPSHSLDAYRATPRMSERRARVASSSTLPAVPVPVPERESVERFFLIARINALLSRMAVGTWKDIRKNLWDDCSKGGVVSTIATDTPLFAIAISTSIES
ncbi:hypothetical protein D9619_012438 [Psilocybe cf. subviscida]|uniref:Uncharacterized protein n=1 Tax=Psilocybe cf. subviscida TaxID=2480587 RepID=A0A8H5ERA6_9AGAR|nr:hypothetical protein D9619_012438 [Psilocybe cf. subviscida]